uniref:Replication protein A 70 kDa DNA-binding subunit B n=1 Tax=Noccaea caerulescens TaxID=107243 RepID=A0A1J3JHA3_NOCCA
MMAGQEADLAPLLPKKIPIDNLILGRSMQHVVVRVLRMWEARNFKHNGTLMSLDFLLLDEKEKIIQGSIFHRRIDRFKHLLKEGNIYFLTNFEVVPTYNHYKVCENPFTIRFTDSTQIMELAEENFSIKNEKFRLCSYSEFSSFAGSNLHLLDVVGQVLQVNGSSLDDPSSKQKIILLLLLEDNSTIRVTLWDDQSSEFRQQYSKVDRECMVIVCTSLNPKMFAGKLHLNSTGATKIYSDHSLEAIKTFMERLGIATSSAAATKIDEIVGQVDLENWTINEISEYISSGAIQEKEVICRAKIIDIFSRNGWKYLSCGKCSKKLDRSATSLICNRCQKTTTIGISRFRVELHVESEGSTATFVLFDRDARNLTNTTAEEIIDSQEKGGERVSDLMEIPKCLWEIVGNTMDFQVKITEYNFRTSTKTYTVSRIVEEKTNEVIQCNDSAAKVQLSIVDTKMGKRKNIKIEDGKRSPTFDTTADTSNSEEGDLDEKENLEEEDISQEVASEKGRKKQRKD